MHICKWVARHNWSNRSLILWSLVLTEGSTGVLTVEEDELLVEEAAAPLHKTMMTPPTPNKAKRDLQYATYTSAVSELVFISQPT